MNQAIIFTELQYWQPELHVMVLPVQINGVTVDCHISVKYLLDGQAHSTDVAQLMKVFNAKRFDIEDEIEQFIEDSGGEFDAPILLS
ncbi:DUF1488 domain-containing protein [Shewanella sp. NIFS-20-20]|uniref:DUF1488 domain-containing protein n=1 Tax=Shewanella sp. NIFS-20-20 TaxID=2853806 RepID=UPI001C486187|nr:DUF1488 domain-containing protein [Shewanella sp. NIFS-20-20]MBV7315555.1 DUF1488 domain-containing protein [Shewanella sp. NIFS-20-20]